MHQSNRANQAAAIVLMAVAAVPSVAAFDVRSVDTTNPNSPISGSAELFQSSAGGTDWRPPSIKLIESAIADPDDAPEFDSYVAIACGPTHAGNPEIMGDGFQANPGDLLVIGGDPFAVPNQVRGLWFKDTTLPNSEEPACANLLFGGREAMFLARMSFRSLDGTFPNESVSLGPGGISVDIRDSATLDVGSPATDSLLVRFTSFGTSVQTGMDSGDLSIHSMGAAYELLTVVSYAGPLPGGTARWQIHDLYVVAIPSPSVLVAVGSAVVASLSFRRRSHREYER